MKKQPNSAEQPSSRDHWWNEDFLDLMARRIGLARCRNVLELGAGKGHWTSLILPRCSDDARWTAVDREKRAVATLQRRFASNDRVAVVQGDVLTLGLGHRQYDLVTCQTLLMHVPDVSKILHLAYDLLAPGGLLLLSEPDNFANRVAINSISAELSAPDYGRLAAMWWAYEKGREAHGLGREWIAVQLPALINAEGFKDLAIYHNDRPSVLAPPYGSKAERDSITDWLAAPAHETDVAAREDTLRFVLAGGLSEAEFDAAWAILSALDVNERAAVTGRTLSSCASGNLYLFAARKPAR